MKKFEIGDVVVDKSFPTLKGKVTGFISDNPETVEPEYVIVKTWIPEDEPGFFVTGVYEEFWCAPTEIEKVTDAA